MDGCLCETAGLVPSEAWCGITWIWSYRQLAVSCLPWVLRIEPGSPATSPLGNPSSPTIAFYNDIAKQSLTSRSIKSTVISLYPDVNLAVQRFGCFLHDMSEISSLPPNTRLFQDFQHARTF